MLHLIVQDCNDNIKQLRQETLDFVGPDLWPPNSPDLNLMDYKVWGVMRQRVYECRKNIVDELKLRLVMVALCNRADHNIFIL